MFLHMCVIMFTGGVGLCLGVSLSRGCLCLGGSLSGGLCPGGSVSRGICVQGGLCQGDLPYGNVWAVHILPECILVYIIFYWSENLIIVTSEVRSHYYPRKHHNWCIPPIFSITSPHKTNNDTPSMQVKLKKSALSREK